MLCDKRSTKLQDGVSIAFVVTGTEKRTYFLIDLKASYWIGLTDELMEGVFSWVDTDTIAEFTDWESGQPDDHRGLQDCAVIRHPLLQWDDIRCSESWEVICELT